jgi:hypothetical protein
MSRPSHSCRFDKPKNSGEEYRSLLVPIRPKYSP